MPNQFLVQFSSFCVITRQMRVLFARKGKAKSRHRNVEHTQKIFLDTPRLIIENIQFGLATAFLLCGPWSVISDPWSVIFQFFQTRDGHINSPFSLPYISFEVNSENLVEHQDNSFSIVDFVLFFFGFTCNMLEHYYFVVRDTPILSNRNLVQRIWLEDIIFRLIVDFQCFRYLLYQVRTYKKRAFFETYRQE